MSDTETSKRVIDLFFVGQEAVEAHRIDDAIASWGAVLQLFDEHGLAEVEDDGAYLPKVAVLMNLAALSQEVQRYDEMRSFAERLVDADPSADAYCLLATATKHTVGDGPALAHLDRALALDPHHASSLHERACVLASRGDVDKAIASVARALHAGSDPEHIRNDDELGALFDHPAFTALFTPESRTAQILDRLRRHSDALRALRPSVGGPPVTDEEIERFEAAIELLPELFAASFGEATPWRAREGDGEEQLDPSLCTQGQREVVETLLACEGLWTAIPFLQALRQIRMPNVSPAEARRELGL
ncbi:MAG: tetratricopeptide repeat protein [Sandaracinaceae bacterium]